MKQYVIVYSNPYTGIAILETDNYFHYNGIQEPALFTKETALCITHAFSDLFIDSLDEYLTFHHISELPTIIEEQKAFEDSLEGLTNQARQEVYASFAFNKE